MHASSYLRDPRVRGLEKRGASYRLVLRSRRYSRGVHASRRQRRSRRLSRAWGAAQARRDRHAHPGGAHLGEESDVARLPAPLRRARRDGHEGRQKGLKSRSGSSVQNYVSKARKWSGTLGEKPISELGERDFERWLAWLDQQTLSENTKRGVQVAVSAVITTAAGDSEHSGLQGNPARAHLDIGEAKTRSSFPVLTESEVAKITMLMPDRDLQVLVEAQYALGLRPAEARGLSWESLSLDTSEYQLAGQLQGRRVVDDLKTRRSATRTKMARGGDASPSLDARVGPARRSRLPSCRRADLESVYRLAFKAAAKAIGRDVTPHALRHSAAMRLRKGGVSTSDLARFMRDEVERSSRSTAPTTGSSSASLAPSSARRRRDTSGPWAATRRCASRSGQVDPAPFGEAPSGVEDPLLVALDGHLRRVEDLERTPPWPGPLDRDARLDGGVFVDERVPRPDARRGGHGDEHLLRLPPERPLVEPRAHRRNLHPARISG